MPEFVDLVGADPDEDSTLQLVSIHPGVTLEQVVEATGFTLGGVDGEVATTVEPDADQLALINQLDPKGLRYREVAA